MLHALAKHISFKQPYILSTQSHWIERISKKIEAASPMPRNIPLLQYTMEANRKRGDTMLWITGFIYVRCSCCKKIIYNINDVFLQLDGLYKKSAYTCVPCVKQSFTFPGISPSNPATCSPSSNVAVAPLIPSNSTPAEEEMVETNEDIHVKCYGCDIAGIPIGDINQYRRGYWCSRSCAYGGLGEIR